MSLNKSLFVGLIGYRKYFLLKFILVSKILLVEDLKVGIKLIDQGDTCGDVEPGYVLVTDVFEELDDRSERISMGHHKNFFALHHAGYYVVEEEWENTFLGVF